MDERLKNYKIRKLKTKVRANFSLTTKDKTLKLGLTFKVS